MLKKTFALLFASVALLVSTSVYAQSYDDDDIYYNPAKAKKATKTVKKTDNNSSNSVYQYQVTDYPAADSYTPSLSVGLNRSVDEYNRRGIFGTEQKSSALTDSLQDDAFQATRQIEKFYNPDIIVAANDDQLTEYYYSQPVSTVNIIVNSPYSYYWDYPYYNGYWGYPYNSWRWNYSWNWGWGPSWNWAWSPSWGWNWGPSWAWGPSWGWGPAWGYAPSWGWHNPRPGSVGNIRPGNSGYRPGNAHAGTAGNIRPGNSGYRPGTVGTTGYRPGNSSSGNGYRPGRGNTRGNASNSNSQSGSYRYNNNNSNSNSNSGYRPNSTSNSSWGSSSGSFRGGSSSGGIRGGGGGRGRH